MEKQELQLPFRVLLEVKTSRTGEETHESMVQLLLNLTNLRFRHFLFLKRGIPLSFEIAVIDQLVHFYISVPLEYQRFLESQIISQYPKASIVKTKDYLPDLLLKEETLSLGQLKLASSFVYPLRIASDFKDVDPMSSILSVLSKSQVGDRVAIQYLLYPVSTHWQAAGKAEANKKIIVDSTTGTTTPNPHAKVIEEKIAYHGFKTAIRIAVQGETKERSSHYLIELANAYSAFNNPSGNALILRKPRLWQKNRLKNAILSRSRYFMPSNQILNVQELAALYHFPTMKLATIPNMAWHQVILSDPPELLPVAETMTDDEKNETNFFARTEFRNKPTVFGIKQKDRRRHFYVIGKTGTGKSTLIANMAIDDMRRRRGFCIIDPHGDLTETVLNFVPSFRVNDVIYLDPSDQEHAFQLNPFEVKDAAQKELVVSGIVSIFNKIFGESWGPRLEYILRNTLQSVIEMPDATLLMVPEVLANPAFRRKMVTHLKDPVLISFWENEFNNYTDKLRIEAISPIQNKVGQFISSLIVRNIIKNPKSTIDLQKVMDEGKIVLMNLSQGKLGEDNAALLGAMFITKFQLAAMNRVYQKEEERRDFYLYVDEFQNFATSSFIKILSEARKYRLNLLLANQYIGQIPEDVRLAIFGNCGTMMTFLVGAGDSPYLAKEYGERFKEEDILALANYQGLIKMMIDGRTSTPFLCFTLPLPKSVTQNREKVIKSSRERYMKPVKHEELESAHDVEKRLRAASESSKPAEAPHIAPVKVHQPQGELAETTQSQQKEPVHMEQQTAAKTPNPARENSQQRQGDIIQVDKKVDQQVGGEKKEQQPQKLQNSPKQNMQQGKHQHQQNAQRGKQNRVGGGGQKPSIQKSRPAAEMKKITDESKKSQMPLSGEFIIKK